MGSLIRVYSGPRRVLADLIRGADLAVVHLGLEDNAEEAVAAACGVVQERGNVLVSGRFPVLARAYWPLARWGAVQDFAAPIPPILEGNAPPGTGHRLALVAWGRLDHINNAEGSRWGPRYSGATTLVGKVSRCPLSPQELAAVDEAVMRGGRGFSLLPTAALATLVHMYSDPGGLVVDLGSPQGHTAAVALALGRRVAVYAEGTGEAELLLKLPEFYEEALRRKAEVPVFSQG